MKSNAYWQKRLAQAFNAIEKDVDYQLAKGYWKTLEDLIKELEKAYDVIYNGAVSGDILLSNLYSYDRYTQIINKINEKLVQLGLKETAVLENAFVEMYKEVGAIISERYGIPTINDLTNDEIKKRISKVWVSDGQSWSARIWKDKDKLKDELTQTLTESLQSGKHTNQFAEELGNRLDASKGRAKTLLRTELAHTQEATALDRYRDAGVKYIRIKCGDFKRKLSYSGKGGKHYYDIPCDYCKEQEIIYDINDPALPILPFHPNCRCSYIPVMDAKLS